MKMVEVLNKKSSLCELGQGGRFSTLCSLNYINWVFPKITVLYPETMCRTKKCWDSELGVRCF